MHASNSEQHSAKVLPSVAMFQTAKLKAEVSLH